MTGLTLETDLFLNDQDPSDIRDIDCLDVVRIVDNVWLDCSVPDVAVGSSSDVLTTSGFL